MAVGFYNGNSVATAAKRMGRRSLTWPCLQSSRGSIEAVGHVASHQISEINYSVTGGFVGDRGTKQRTAKNELNRVETPRRTVGELFRSRCPGEAVLRSMWELRGAETPGAWRPRETCCYAEAGQGSRASDADED